MYVNRKDLKELKRNAEKQLLNGVNPIDLDLKLNNINLRVSKAFCQHVDYELNDIVVFEGRLTSKEKTINIDETNNYLDFSCHNKEFIISVVVLANGWQFIKLNI